MNSIGFLSSIYTVIVSVLVVFIILVLSYRIYSVFIKKRPRKNILHTDNGLYIKLLKLGFGCSMALIIIIAPMYAYIGSAVKSIIPAALNHTFVMVTLCLAALEVYLSLSVSEKLMQNRFKKIMLSVIVVIMLPLSVYMTVNAPAMFEFPSANEAYIIELPVRGTWEAGHAGGSVATNYHNALKAQQYAIDIVKVDEKGKFYKGEGKELNDVFSFGEAVYSPVDGIVVAVVDSLENHNVSLAPSDSLNPAGNHVVIEFEAGRYIFLAHFMPQTITASEGDTVKSGAFIGNVGNSGNSSWPHLHMHIQDIPAIDNRNATGYPFRFAKMERKRWFTWSTIKNGFLTRNDHFREIRNDN